MAEEIKAQVSEVIPENVEVKNTDTPETSSNQAIVVDSFKDILREVLSNPKNRVYKNVRVKKVSQRDSDDVDWENLTFVIEGKVPGPEKDGDTFKIGLTSNIYTTSYTVAALLKQNPRTSMLADMVLKNPEIIPVILSGCTFNLIQTDVAKNEVYYNPFSNKETRKAYTYDHDWIVNNIYNLTLGENGEAVINGIIGSIVNIAMGKK